MKQHDFLVQHAKFPFPIPVEDRTAITTDVSEFEVGLLKKEWRANHAVLDDTLAQKLCHTLETILGDTLLSADSEHYLLSSFGRGLQFDERGSEDGEWSVNPSEIQVSFQNDSSPSFKIQQCGGQSRTLLDKGVFQAARKCLWEYDQYLFKTIKEDVAVGGSSKVDYVAQVDGKGIALCEANSPSVMKKVGEWLPPHGIKLTWVRSQPLVPKIFAKVSMPFSSVTLVLKGYV